MVGRVHAIGKIDANYHVAFPRDRRIEENGSLGRRGTSNESPILRNHGYRRVSRRFGIAGLDRCLAASTTVEQALRLTPVQQGVDYDRPTPEEAAKCKISVKKDGGRVGWVVESPEGLILRKFIDTNGDDVVDQWSYYKDGVEVYRDIDSDFNGKPDQYRWLNAGGTRWGVDKRDANGVETGKSTTGRQFRRKRRRPRRSPRWPRTTSSGSAGCC